MYSTTLLVEIKKTVKEKRYISAHTFPKNDANEDLTDSHSFLSSRIQLAWKIDKKTGN